MSSVRERRHQKALSLSLPPPIPAANFRHHHQSLSSSTSSSPSPLSSTSSNSPTIDNLSDLEKLVVLGHGNGGTVYKVRHRHTMAIYALKVIRFGKTGSTVQQSACEAEILNRVDSEFIVRCYGVFGHDSIDARAAQEGNGGDLCFVMEFMEEGSLLDILLMQQRLPEKEIAKVARRVLEGLQYLHNMQIVHRDIKPSNLLINGRGEIKIADFGVAEMLEEERYSYMGTCAYMSPERVDRERWNADSPCVGFAGDVWSLGVVVLECHVGRFPLISPGEKPDWATLMCAICLAEKAVVPETASPEFQNFVWRCLEKDWRVRGTVEELLAHPFLTKYYSASSELVGYGLDD